MTIREHLEAQARLDPVHKGYDVATLVQMLVEAREHAVAALRDLAGLEDALNRAACHPDDDLYLRACIEAALNYLGRPESATSSPRGHK